MYIPPAFNETDPKTLHDFIERHSFGELFSQVDEQPFATHLPFLLDRNAGQNGTLIGHMAAANPQCLKAGEQTVLAVFSGPHRYISPTWYEAENVVPTWNYVAVHVYGKIELINDQSELLDVVQRTTAFYEKTMPNPWSFDVTSTFVNRLLSQIIGFKITIEKIEGKWKTVRKRSFEPFRNETTRILNPSPD
jgi:transcriptional regulator